MSLPRILLLIAITLLPVLLAVAFQAVPGYMDAEYVYAGGLRLAQGNGFSELFLWNYLDDPSGLPHPSHAYWMPLASIVAAAGMGLTGQFTYAAARLPFFLLALCIPLLTARLSLLLTAGVEAAERRSDLAFLAGLLAAFPAFYLPFSGVTETFTLYMILGASWLLAAGALVGRRPWLAAACLGLLSGGMHLARVDGLLWLGLALLAIVFLPAQAGPLSRAGRLRQRGILLIGCLALYGLVMGPWLWRNWMVFGTPLSPGGARSLWITHYDELFSYPATLLTPQRWWSGGFPALLQARWQAASLNLQTALAVQGEIFLLPLICIGLWRLRRDRRIQWGVLAWGMTLGIMTLVFPFAGGRGGFFHSGAALQPLFWAVAPLGLMTAVEWGGRRRHWNLSQAGRVFGFGTVLLVILMTARIGVQRILGADWRRPEWSQPAMRYREIEAELQQLGIPAGALVMVNNPPGYFVATARQCIVIPDGDMSVAWSAARRYGADYLLLESDHPRALETAYQQPGDWPGWQYLGKTQVVIIFRRIP